MPYPSSLSNLFVKVKPIGALNPAQRHDSHSKSPSQIWTTKTSKNNVEPTTRRSEVSLHMLYNIYIYNIDILIDLSWPILDALHFLLG
jgi:hypothetical protein